jgi:hypothetical protein
MQTRENANADLSFAIKLSSYLMVEALAAVHILILQQPGHKDVRNCSTVCNPRGILHRQATTAAKTYSGLTVKDETS